MLQVFKGTTRGHRRLQRVTWRYKGLEGGNKGLQGASRGYRELQGL